MTAKPSWRCKDCWCINKFSFKCCPSCGLKWQQVADKSYVHQQGTTGGDPYNHTWDYSDPPYHQQAVRHPSPRGPRRPKSPRGGYHGGHSGEPVDYHGGKQGGKGGKNNKGKQGNKGKQQMNTPGKGPSKSEPVLDWKAALRPQPKESTVIATPSAPAPGSAEAGLNELTSALQAGDSQLSPQVQGILAQNAADSTRNAAKEELASNQSTAAKLYTAKTALAAAETARASLHAIWQGHISECVERWTAYQQEFTEQDAALKATVDAALETLKAARQAWVETKDEAMEISDTEESSALKPEAGEIIQQGLAKMVRGLEEVKGQTDALSEPPTKKVKAGDVSKLGAAALQPFGGAGK